MNIEDNSPRVENYFKDERIPTALRNLVVNLNRQVRIPEEYLKPLLKIINEDELTEGYLDFLLEEYELKDTPDYTDSIDFGCDPFDADGFTST